MVSSTKPIAWHGESKVAYVVRLPMETLVYGQASRGSCGLRYFVEVVLVEAGEKEGGRPVLRSGRTWYPRSFYSPSLMLAPTTGLADTDEGEWLSEDASDGVVRVDRCLKMPSPRCLMLMRVMRD